MKVKEPMEEAEAEAINPYKVIDFYEAKYRLRLAMMPDGVDVDNIITRGMRRIIEANRKGANTYESWS